MPTLTTIQYQFDSNLTVTSLISLPKPVVSLQAFGATGSTIYSYRVSALNSYGETLASDPVVIGNGNSVLSSSNFVRVSWQYIEFSTSYKVYGRTVNGELLLATVYDTYFDDYGNLNPSGALPTKDTSGYDADKLSVGRFQKLFTGSNDLYDNYISSLPAFNYAFGEDYMNFLNRRDNTQRYFHFIRAVKISENIIWIFILRYHASGSNIRGIEFFTFNRSSWSVTWNGSLNITFNSNQAAGDIDFDIMYEKTTEGYVETVDGSFLISGTNTVFLDRKISINSRIGFGSNDPTKISQWFTISEIISNTKLTINGVPNVIGKYVRYVIEEIRFVVATNVNGLYYVKGIVPEDFRVNNPINTIAVSAGLDRRKLVYNLRDANTNSFVNITGIAIGPKIDENTQYLYVRNSRVSVFNDTKFFVFNLRKDLTVVNNYDITAFSFSSGFLPSLNRQGYFYGLKYIKPKSGIYKDKDLLMFRMQYDILLVEPHKIIKDGKYYFDTSYTLSRGSIPYVRSYDSQNTPDFHYDPYTDSFIWSPYGDRPLNISNLSTGMEEPRWFHMGYAFSSDLFKKNIRDYSHHLTGGGQKYLSSVDGILFLSNYQVQYQYPNMTHMHVYPIGSDCDLPSESENRVICPKISTINFSKLTRLQVDNQHMTGENPDFSLPNDPYRVFYRTEGIEDNSGAWTKLTEDFTLSHINLKTHIQFMFNFKQGLTLIPARVYSYALVGEKLELLPNIFRFNSNVSNLSGNIFGFEQIKVNSNSFNLKITIYREKDNKILFTQTSSSTQFGTFQYFNVNNWVSGVGSNSIGTLRRFVFNSGFVNDGKLKIKIELI
jgi:hypothetical protein